MSKIEKLKQITVINTFRSKKEIDLERQYQCADNELNLSDFLFLLRSTILEQERQINNLKEYIDRKL